LSEWDGRIF
jgi:hypothetical protein